MELPSLDLTDGQMAFLDVVGIISTALAALLAVMAIVQAGRQGRKAQEALLRERRVDHELGVLRAIGDVMFHDVHIFGSDAVDDQLQLLRALAPDDELPSLMAGKAWEQRDQIRDEIEAAIRRRTSELGSSQP